MINALLWFSVLCCSLAVAALLFSVVVHRRQAERKQLFHHNSLTELAWNLVPVVILLCMALPAVVERGPAFHWVNDYFSAASEVFP